MLGGLLPWLWDADHQTLRRGVRGNRTRLALSQHRKRSILSFLLLWHAIRKPAGQSRIGNTLNVLPILLEKPGLVSRIRSVTQNWKA
jgi:hypothetical protein